jgi:LPXTG-motif cell wall-anchored protein
MKSVILASVAALALVALPAAAQYENNLGATTATQQPAEQRTNAAVPTHSEDPGLTATGTVDSFNSEEVVINTSTGLTHIKIMPATTGMRTFTKGQAISVDFTRNEQGVLLATQIRNADAVSTLPTTGSVAAGEAVAATAENVGDAVEEGVEETTKSDLDNDGAIGTRGAPTGSGTTPSTAVAVQPVDTTTSTTTSLPATGSNTPLVGLLGLLALGGAAVVRRLS